MEQFQESPEYIKDKIRNTIQARLAMRHTEGMEVFIQKHAKDVRNLLDAHPEFFEEYKTDPEKVMAKVEKEIY